MVATLKTRKFLAGDTYGGERASEAIAVETEIDGKTFGCDVYESGEIIDWRDGNGLLANNHATKAEVCGAASRHHNHICDQCGATGIEFDDLLTLADDRRICGKCEHANEAAV